MKNKKYGEIVKVDSRHRITIPKNLSRQLAQLYRIFEKDGKIILEPIKETPKEEMWLFDPKNKKIVDELKEALKEPATKYKYLGSFKKYLK